MSRIYQGDTRLSNTQVAEVLVEEMPDSHARIIKGQINNDIKNYRKRFAHAVLDAYRFLPTTTEDEEKSKRYCKYLLDKYMKSSSPIDGEEAIIKLIVEKINN